MKVKTLGALICVVASAATSCVADDDVRWVSPTGDDTKDGLTEATAWKTPQKAVDFFGTGAGTVRLTAGTFEGANPILNIASGAVKVIGAGRDLTVIKPDNTVAKSAVSVVKSGAVVSNLTVTGCSGAYAVSLQNGGGIVFCNVVSNTAGGVKFVAAATSSFCRNCSVSFNSNASGPSAVYHNSWGAAYLRNCLFIGNTTTKASCGTVTADNGGALKVTFCTFVNNEGTATGGVCNDNNQVAVKNCIFKDNRCGVTVTTCDFAGKYPQLTTITNCMSDQGGGTDPVFGDPAFRGAAAGDFHLRLMSACRNAGVATTAVDGAVDATDVDFYGQPRVSGSTPDVGCVECQEPTAAVCDVDISNSSPHYAENLVFESYFEQLPAGASYDCGWTLCAPTGDVVTNLFGSKVEVSFDVLGLYSLTLSATNRGNRAEVLKASVPLDFDLPLTNFVATAGSGNGVWPYAHQETATTSFEAAVGAMSRGGVIQLLPGTFTGPQPLLTVTNGVRVCGSGIGVTFLKPDNTVADYTVKLSADGASLSGVTLVGNTRKRAVLIDKSASMADSLVISNSVGGVSIASGNVTGGAGVSHCTFLGNSTTSDNGGAISIASWGNVRIDNCLFAGNRSDKNGGAAYCDNGLNAGRHRFEYCTFVSNKAGADGGGIYSNWTAAQVKNCIVKDNVCSTSKATPNFGCNQAMSSSFSIANTWNLEGYGTNPISGDVAFKDVSAGNYRLRATSVCRDAGVDLTGDDAAQKDLDGNPRVWGDAPDVGCYEYVVGAESMCDITGLTKDETWRGSTMTVGATITPRTPGSSFDYYWKLLDESGATVGSSNAASYSFTVTGYGLYSLELTVVNRADPMDTAGCTLANAFVSRPLTNYVVAASSGMDGAVPPYDSWETASTNLQAAIDSVCIGGTVVLASGVHKVGDVNVLRDITIEGVRGDVPASLSYKGAKRMIYVNSKGAVLRNLTLRDAIYTGYGSGSSLWIGPSGGTAEGCTFIGNKARASQASIELGGADARLTRCRLVGNTITDGSARIVQMSQGQVDNCLFEANSNMAGRAVLSLTGAKARLVNNTFVDNVATGAVLFTAKPTANAMLNCILADTRRADGSTGDEWTTSLTAPSDLSALEAAVSNCCFATGRTLGANAVAGDPRFRMDADHLWQLKSTSPCVNAGFGTSELDSMVDLKGEARVKSGLGTDRRLVDIGCYERLHSGGMRIILR